MDSLTQTLEREKKWTLPAGIAAVAGVAMYFIGQWVSRSGIGSPEGTAEILEAVNEHSSNVLLGSAIQGAGIALLAAPLAFLFLAALARSDRMRRGLVVIAVAGPVFLGLGTFFSALSLVDASDSWQGEKTPGVTKCYEDEAGAGDEGEAPAALTDEQKDDCLDEVAADLRGEAGTAGLALGLLAGGGIGFLIALLYTGLNAMRTGLLTRFWGSLGMAVGVILLLPQLQIIAFAWFIFLGLLLAGWIPGGRPPAWETGRAIPWPVPGETRDDDPDDDDVIDGSADEIEISAAELEPGEAEDFPDGPQGELRKRKKRN